MTWAEFISLEQDKPYYSKLMAFLSEEAKTKTILPPQEQWFEAFKLTPFDQVKVVILGQDPYHDIGQAHGLAFSVNEGVRIPPSLKNIFKLLETNQKMEVPNSGNLTSWAKQGVLLLNTILTVQAHMPLSHANKGWEIFTDHVMEELNKDNNPKVFILWGNTARKKKTMITNNNHLIIESSHPSPLSARHSFFDSACFSRANQFLKSNNIRQINFTLN
jgi:uracil-DNA glycosylase